jgi:hypothetical protein
VTVADTSGDPAAAEAAAEIRTLSKLAGTLGNFEVPYDQRVAFALGFGWWMRIVRTAEGICLLYDAGLSQEASPLLRTLLHHTAALEWLRLFPEEVLDALREEHEQRRHDLAAHATRRDWELTGLDLGQRPEKKKLEGLRYLREFEKMCDHVGATNLYVAYKLESAYAHPSGLSADTYIELGDNGLPFLRDRPVISGVPLKTTAMFAATATRILGQLIGDERLIAAADRVGDVLDVPTAIAADDTNVSD